MKAITTTFSGPKNVRGSRIIAKDSDGNRVIFDHSMADNHDEAHANAARALCKKMGWTGTLVQGSLGAGKEVFVWLEDNQVPVTGDSNLDATCKRFHASFIRAKEQL